MLLHEATKDGGDNKEDDDLTRQSLPGEQIEQIEAERKQFNDTSAIYIT